MDLRSHGSGAAEGQGQEGTDRLKVLFVSDVHTSESALGWVARRGRGYGAIIVGGDLARDSPESQKFAPRFLEAALSSNGSVFYVPGNADIPGTPVPGGTVNLHGKTGSLGRYKLGGLGGSNATPFHTPNELSDAEAERVLAALGHVDVLVSHCPPQGTRCDKVPGGHIGSIPVRRYVEREKPMLVLSGHAHESRAVDNLGGTTLVNPGPLREGKYAEVSLEGVVSVELKAESLEG
jgi:Icc-related predicted phosphoesterase